VTAPPPYRAPDHKQWRAAPSPGWRAPSQHTRCRGHGCPRPPAAELNRGVYTARGRRNSFWAYCAAHAADYGHWVEDGQVWHWELHEKRMAG
jgi:hypothetical protein